MTTWFITRASRGFGLRVARLALTRGHNVVATARSAEAVRTALGSHERLLAVALDVTAEDQALAAVAEAIERFVYSSTKFAVEGLSEALHAELGPLGIGVTAVEPGYFRTDFLDSSSLSVSPHGIVDYNGTAGAVRLRAADLNHAQPGDPERLAQVLIDFAEAPNPPVRLPLGSDTVAAIEAKHAADAAILAEWRSVSVSTDFAVGDPAVV